MSQDPVRTAASLDCQPKSAEDAVMVSQKWRDGILKALAQRPSAPISGRARDVNNVAGAMAGYGCCYKCRDTWNWKPSHSTRYSESASCFPLCEECWDALTPTERYSFYMEMVRDWTRTGGVAEGTQEAIEKAVMEGK